MLDLSITLLSETYHGKEWPPSPARLFQAVVAGSRYRFRHGVGWKPEFDAALRWLESLPPPVIVAPPVRDGSPYLVFGPDNDLDLWVREQINVARDRPSKKPTDLATLRSQIERRPKYASGTVHYLYPHEGVPPHELEELVQSVVALGHGVDLASGDIERLSEDEQRALPGDRWEPGQGGDVQLFVPIPGWYERLDANYQRWSRPPSMEDHRVDARRGTIPPSIRPVSYRSPFDRTARPFHAFGLERLSDARPQSFCWEDGMELAAQLRHCASETLRSLGADEPFLRTYALGHGKGVERDRRLSYVPLPSIGHRFVDGRVRRAMVVGPRGPWDPQARDLGTLLEGARLTPLGGGTESRLVPLQTDDRVVSRYLGPSRTWSTVTPVILHGHDSRNARVDVRRTRVLIEEALDQADLLGAIEGYAYRNASWWSGCGSARSIRVPSHLSTWPRYHLRVESRHDLRGPLLVGIGRHYGIGLLAAEEPMMPLGPSAAPSRGRGRLGLPRLS